jgi:hypothetical protein
MPGGFGAGPFGEGEFGIDEVPFLPEVWLDSEFGSDETGDGSRENPIKSFETLLTLITSWTLIYINNTLIGQPGYIEEIADPVFWNLDAAEVET